MAGVAAKIRQWWANPSPAGHLPGVLLSRLQHDLHGLEFQALSDTQGRFRALDRQLEFHVQEHVQPQFLMHVVTAEFVYRVPRSAPGNQRLVIRHRGSWRREGIALHPPAPRLSNDPALVQALLPLDFTRCELVQDSLGWQCRLTHYGASEVVCRFPPLRRYVRLSTTQRDALLATFCALRNLLAEDSEVP